MNSFIITSLCIRFTLWAHNKVSFLPLIKTNYYRLAGICRKPKVRMMMMVTITKMMMIVTPLMTVTMTKMTMLVTLMRVVGVVGGCRQGGGRRQGGKSLKSTKYSQGGYEMKKEEKEYTTIHLMLCYNHFALCPMY